MNIEESWVCQDCGGDGDRHEILKNDGGDTKEQLWIYCSDCGVETFYDIPDDY